MDIILKKFFLSRTFGNLIIDNINKNRKITIKYYDFTRINRIDAKITLSLKPDKYKLYLTSNKDIEFEIKSNDKILLNENKNKVYFTINNNYTITSLNQDSFIKTNNTKKLTRDTNIKFWHLYWNSLHYLSYNYPISPTNSDKDQIVKLLDRMKSDGITCGFCRKHFNMWIKKNKIQNYYNNRNNLITYFINLHNNVNINNNKKIFIRTEVDEIYLNFDYNYLVRYGLNIIELFNSGTISKLPDIINTKTRHILLHEFNVI